LATEAIQNFLGSFLFWQENCKSTGWEQLKGKSWHTKTRKELKNRQTSNLDKQERGGEGNETNINR
jgi:hypothetical protein